jgi:hypothetical protein
MIVIPQGIEFVEWSNTLYVDLPTLNLPLASDETHWKEWAETLILDNQLVDIPLPQNFDDWRNWAEYFVNNV